MYTILNNIEVYGEPENPSPCSEIRCQWGEWTCVRKFVLLKQTSKTLQIKFMHSLKVASKHENDPFWNWNYALWTVCVWLVQNTRVTKIRITRAFCRVQWDLQMCTKLSHFNKRFLKYVSFCLTLIWFDFPCFNGYHLRT